MLYAAKSPSLRFFHTSIDAWQTKHHYCTVHNKQLEQAEGASVVAGGRNTASRNVQRRRLNECSEACKGYEGKAWRSMMGPAWVGRGGGAQAHASSEHSVRGVG